MVKYRRAMTEEATYFFTVNCVECRGNSLLMNNIERRSYWCGSFLTASYGL